MPSFVQYSTFYFYLNKRKLLLDLLCHLVFFNSNMISVQLADTAIRTVWFIPPMFCTVWPCPALSLTHLVTSDIFWVTGPASDFNIRKKSRDLRMSESQEHEASIMIMFPVTQDNNNVTVTTLQNKDAKHCKSWKQFYSLSCCFLEAVEIFRVSSAESAVRCSHWELAKT